MCIPANFELLCQATAEEQRQIGQYINHMAASIKESDAKNEPYTWGQLRFKEEVEIFNASCPRKSRIQKLKAWVKSIF